VSTLVLIRHGQASFFDDDYDRLSELGREQSRRLAAYWRVRGIRFDAAYAGPLERQRATAEEVRRALDGGEWELPVPRVMAEWSEYDGSLLAAAWQREMAEREPDLVGSDGERPERRAAHARSFQRAFEVMMRQWVTGERVVAGAESWREFQARVWRGMDEIFAAHPKGAIVAVFTSGGAIAVALQRVLALADLTALELNWTVRNCSFSEVLYQGDRRSLSTYNCTGHLEPDLITYR
jgi:broad specificity phosphatase PhoE